MGNCFLLSPNYCDFRNRETSLLCLSRKHLRTLSRGFEAYATINDGSGVKVFQIPPPKGNTVMNLPGDANRNVYYRLEDSDGDGVFDKLTLLP